MLSLACAAGCGSASSGVPPVLEGSVTGPQLDNYDRAMESFAQRAQFDTVVAMEAVCRELNRWIDDTRPEVDWAKDELVDRMPEIYHQIVSTSELERLRFDAADYFYLEESAWMHAVAEWASLPRRTGHLALWQRQAAARLDESRRKELFRADDRLAATMRVFDPTLSDSDADQLARAFRLFDWTVRNTQLDPLLPAAKGPVAGPAVEPDQAGANQNVPLAWRGIPGPGYLRSPREVLLLGHGDAWQRARVFIQLCRQQQIDAVMLGFDEGTRTSRAQPWLPAVFVNEQLYLFDTWLGIPLPDESGGGIATLAKVLAQPSLVTSLDLPKVEVRNDTPDSAAADQGAEQPDPPLYPLAERKLKQIVALIDATPPALSKRMKILEGKLTASQKMILTARPSELAKRVQQSEGITQVYLWTLPIDTMAFRAALEELGRRNMQAVQEFFDEELLVSGLGPLALGRRRHFQGALDKRLDEDTDGAIATYQEAWLPTGVIDRLESDARAQAELQVVREPGEDEATWKEKVRRAQFFFRAAWAHAQFWSGVAMYDAENYDNASDWLKRTIEAGTDTPWTALARYNLARSYEATGRWDQARRLYLQDDSPQRFGNRLRATMIEKLLDENPPASGEVLNP